VTGYTEWFKKEPEKEDCTLARVVQHYGAVCIAKTNVPQTMLNFECRNYAYGQTTNPYSKAHTAGGSSGGEAALLAMDGAAFGFGSDIGGSLRIPTSYCGIYAIKPSNGRGWPRAGNIDIGPSPMAITSVAGPMCRSAADLELLTTLFADALTPSNTQSLRDVQLRFGDEVEALYPLRSTWFDPLATAAARKADANVAAGQRKTLRIGYYRCDGFTKTSPPCLRAVDLAVKALQSVKGKDGAKAIELVEVDPSRLQTFETLRRFVGLTSITAYEHLTRHLGPDPVDPALKVTLALPRYPVLRWIVGLVARYILGDRQLPKIFAESNKRKASVYFAHQYEQKKMQRRFEREVWNQLDLDAIVCPVQASPALPHYGSTLLAPLAASTILYNVLGNPVTVVPVTRVDSSLDANPTWNAPKGTETCSTMVTTRLQQNFDPTSQHGLPIAVQIVTRDYEDEYAIGLAKVLDDALAAQDGNHRKQFGPGAWQRYTSSNR
jgi:amidase